MSAVMEVGARTRVVPNGPMSVALEAGARMSASERGDCTSGRAAMIIGLVKPATFGCYAILGATRTQRGGTDHTDHTDHADLARDHSGRARAGASVDVK